MGSPDEHVLAEPLCSAKASAAGVEQQWAALFRLQIMYGFKETVGFLKKTYGDVILSGDHANFSICIGFWLNACQRSPSSGARHWLAQGCPGDCDTDRDVMLLSPDRTTWIFPKAWTAQRAAAAAVEGEPRPQHLRVSLAQVVFGSPCINGINHHFGFCSWDAARGSKLRFGGKH